MRIVDLFSGVGGLTFGFYYDKVNNQFIRKDDQHIIFANEYNPIAAEAFSENFPDINMINRDIRDLQEDEILELVGDDDVDVIIGGPPCQSYSLIGRRRYDDQARLYNEYYRMLSIIHPKMFLFENVKGMISMRDESGNLIIDDLLEKFENIDNDFGYRVEYHIIDAANYGVPQHRERVFFIGIRDDLNIKWTMPQICENQITLEEAISDFPPVASGEEAHHYILEPQNNFQRLMRGDSEYITCHFCALYGDKIQTVINHVPQGEGREYINNLVSMGLLDKKYRLTSGYKNTYGRLYPDRPCPTITHNMSTPSGLRCIHYIQNRALTPREGARIQTFPDWFQFRGNRSEIKTQIGNAVPPLLAMKLAKQIEKALEMER
ncbi:DNA cytosine methyltransferase [Thomasclavelia cocleata]|uniref:DNA cytosine methyltransferase n=1 Tax=Thomasclavelia cocleata TaxID=69824 RepID=UPI00248B7582|nr:DNA cytosine methyltransferase [Thomasclavelia cocleata]